MSRSSSFSSRSFLGDITHLALVYEAMAILGESSDDPVFSFLLLLLLLPFGFPSRHVLDVGGRRVR